MKQLIVLSLFLLALSLGAKLAMTQAGDVVVHSATVEMTHFTGTEPIDQIDMTANFTNNEFVELRKCEPADSFTGSRLPSSRVCAEQRHEKAI